VRLNGKVAAVTGGGHNIGAEMCKLFAREGARVAVNDVVQERAEGVVQEIISSGGTATSVIADIRQADQVNDMIDKIVKEWGAPDILINNVAVQVKKSVLDTSEEEWDYVIDTILKGAFLCTKYVVKAMQKANKGGAILNVSSTSGHRGNKSRIAYCTAKGGILNMTRALAVDLAPFGIRVNSLTPTMTGTQVGQDSGAEARPVDQANAALFLVSEEASFITGADLIVDGGVLAELKA
jgi:NAD(P)-dependent dehydrogenase (short-subunit alcohol dehydrogenase family)